VTSTDDVTGPAGETIGGPGPLDTPVLASLTGAHAHLARARGNARRYPADVSPFCALPGDPSPADWADLAALVSPGEVVIVPGLRGAPPAGWEVAWSGAGAQLVADGVDARPDPEAVPLGPADVPAMLDLTRRTEPGPFLPRTIELGRYLGIRRDGQLAAMAGERMRVPGWTEVSAVCTDPAFRGQGLAARLTLAVTAAIEARGERAFLHVLATNTAALRVYQRLGFVPRLEFAFVMVRRAAAPPAA
jgi:ribosomal protein S18 acetylase RimI-like enzyme